MKIGNPSKAIIRINSQDTLSISPDEKMGITFFSENGDDSVTWTINLCFLKEAIINRLNLENFVGESNQKIHE